MAGCVREALLALGERVAQGMERFEHALARGGAVEVPGIDDLLEAARARLLPLLAKWVEGRRACLAFFPILYYARKTHEVLAAMAADRNVWDP